MASDGIDLRLNGVVYGSTGKYAEILKLRWGYFGPSSATLVDNSRYHDDKPKIVQNDLVEISTDNFATLVWKGRVTQVHPNSIGQEGVQWGVKGLEHVINRWVCRWNDRSDYNYNHNFQQQLDSPQFMTGSLGSGVINLKSRWSNGEILLDILEHAFGINTLSRLTSGGGSANMPITSDIPFHHVSQYSITNPYAHLYPLGAARDYVDQLTWDPAEILTLMNVYIPNITFNNNHLWEVIHRIVEHSGNHGVFIDVTIPTQPWLRIHKFDNSTQVFMTAAKPGEHIETPSRRIVSDIWEFSTETVRNLIRIEGRRRLKATDPTLPANNPASGKLIKMDANGFVWRIQNQDIIPFIVGWDRTDVNQPFRQLDITRNENYGPVLYENIGGANIAAYTANAMISFPEHGLMLSKVGLPDKDWRIWTIYEEPFVISVGPGAGYCPQRPISGIGSTPLYPTPSSFDCFAQYGFVNEMNITIHDFLHNTRQVDQIWNSVQSKPPPHPTRNDGEFQQGLFTSRGIHDAGYPAIAQDPTVRDDSPYMILWAEEIQRRYRDERVKLTLTIDSIKLGSIFTLFDIQPVIVAGVIITPGSGSEPGLKRKISISGLRNNRWIDADLQVMSIECDLRTDHMILELTNDIYNSDMMPPAVWQRIEQNRQMEYVAKQLQRYSTGSLTAMVRGGIGERQASMQSSKAEPYAAERSSLSAFTDATLKPQ